MLMVMGSFFCDRGHRQIFFATVPTVNGAGTLDRLGKANITRVLVRGVHWCRRRSQDRTPPKAPKNQQDTDQRTQKAAGTKARSGRLLRSAAHCSPCGTGAAPDKTPRARFPTPTHAAPRRLPCLAAAAARVVEPSDGASRCQINQSPFTARHHHPQSSSSRAPSKIIQSHPFSRVRPRTAASCAPRRSRYPSF